MLEIWYSIDSTIQGELDHEDFNIFNVDNINNANNNNFIDKYAISR